ncbi:GNAT family N-acetyltransferase [Enterovibrio calviensis]|uniref:GNAT family N-acetyltransferase n=1 Tax=Enterovibrio calviensis TaxID=91359 RepID=UPI001FE17CA7
MCFIATCDGEPCGYIVGTDNSKQFSERCEGEWLPALRERYPLEQYKGKSASDWVVNKIHEGNAPRPEFDAYPAHFHINCLPETQGFGVGRKLIMTLIERLMASKISGVHLEVSTVNTGAITFYEKLGFTQIATFEHSLGYGMELCAQ